MLNLEGRFANKNAKIYFENFGHTRDVEIVHYLR